MCDIRQKHLYANWSLNTGLIWPTQPTSQFVFYCELHKCVVTALGNCPGKPDIPDNLEQEVKRILFELGKQT